MRQITAWLWNHTHPHQPTESATSPPSRSPAAMATAVKEPKPKEQAPDSPGKGKTASPQKQQQTQRQQKTSGRKLAEKISGSDRGKGGRSEKPNDEEMGKAAGSSAAQKPTKGRATPASQQKSPVGKSAMKSGANDPGEGALEGGLDKEVVGKSTPGSPAKRKAAKRKAPSTKSQELPGGTSVVPDSDDEPLVLPGRRLAKRQAVATEPKGDPSPKPTPLYSPGGEGRSHRKKVPNRKFVESEPKDLKAVDSEPEDDFEDESGAGDGKAVGRGGGVTGERQYRHQKGDSPLEAAAEGEGVEEGRERLMEEVMATAKKGGKARDTAAARKAGRIPIRHTKLLDLLNIPL